MTLVCAMPVFTSSWKSCILFNEWPIYLFTCSSELPMD